MRPEYYNFLPVIPRKLISLAYAWRDPVMHVRSRFDEPQQAENVFNHVKRFMEKLVENGIGE
jgi:hypothetical protein